MPAADKPIRVFIADDHPVVRQSLNDIIGLQDDLTVVGEAASLDELVANIDSANPDIVILDLELDPRSDDKFASLMAVRNNFPALKIIVYTAHADEQRTIKAVELGVEGYILKKSEPRELLSAIRIVHAGGSSMNAAVTSTVMRHVRRDYRQRSQPAAPSISRRERDVLNLLAQGRSNQQVAASLDISERTVKRHVSSILNKLGVKNRTAAVLEADRQGILDQPIG